MCCYLLHYCVSIFTDLIGSERNGADSAERLIRRASGVILMCLLTHKISTKYTILVITQLYNRLIIPACEFGSVDYCWSYIRDPVSYMTLYLMPDVATITIPFVVFIPARPSATHYSCGVCITNSNNGFIVRTMLWEQHCVRIYITHYDSTLYTAELADRLQVFLL